MEHSPAEIARREAFLRTADEAYARLQADPVLWAEELAERRLLEGTLMDDLEDDPWPYEEEAQLAALADSGESGKPTSARSEDSNGTDTVPR